MEGGGFPVTVSEVLPNNSVGAVNTPEGVERQSTVCQPGFESVNWT